jgi:excisionase family DNA binding protein
LDAPRLPLNDRVPKTEARDGIISPPHGQVSWPRERLLSADEVAELLSVPVTWVRERTRAGHLPHVRLGRYVRYERNEVMAWLSEQTSGRGRGSSFRSGEAGGDA